MGTDGRRLTEFRAIGEILQRYFVGRAEVPGRLTGTPVVGKIGHVDHGPRPAPAMQRQILRMFLFPGLGRMSFPSRKQTKASGCFRCGGFLPFHEEVVHLGNKSQWLGLEDGTGPFIWWSGSTACVGGGAARRAICRRFRFCAGPSREDSVHSSQISRCNCAPCLI